MRREGETDEKIIPETTIVTPAAVCFGYRLPYFPVTFAHALRRTRYGVTVHVRLDRAPPTLVPF